MIATGAGKRQVDEMRGLAAGLVDRQRETARSQREQLDGATSRAITLALIGLLAIPLLLAVLVYTSARRISRPLQRLARAARRVQAGDLLIQVEESGVAEVDELAHSFNAMAESLAEAREELELHNAELEAQGAQLAATVDELELEKARIETFHDVVTAFAAEVELDRLGPLLLNKLRSVAGARGGALYVADPIDLERGLGLYETAAIDPATLPRSFTPDAVERELVRHLLLPLALRPATRRRDPARPVLARPRDAAADGRRRGDRALERARAGNRAPSRRRQPRGARDRARRVHRGRRRRPDLVLVAAGRSAVRVHGEGGARRAHRRAGDPGALGASYRVEHDALLATRTDTRRFQLPAMHRDGRRLTIEVSVSPLQVGDTWQINGFVRDIGERVAQERAREAQRAVSQALAEAGAGEDVVPRLLEALGRSLHWPAAVHWADPLGGERRRAAEWRDPDHDGRELPISVSVPIGDGPTGFGSFEFWQRRRIPLDPNLSDALDAIAELVAEVLERRRAEAETEKLKDEFFALVSHELRTPLTSIIGYLELMLEEEAGEVADEQRQFLDGHRAQLAPAAAARRRPAVRRPGGGRQAQPGATEVDLEAVVRDAVEAARPRAEQEGVELMAHTDRCPPWTATAIASRRCSTT